MKSKQKSLPKLKSECQKVFNEFIRKRDEGKPCISCGQFKPLQAGHYFAVKGYDGLRFDEDNVQGECIGCNCFDDSHLIGYGKQLVIRIGIIRYNDLCIRAAKYKRDGYKWTRSELIEKIEIYKHKLNNCEKNK
jgi:hypothetical protein